MGDPSKKRARPRLSDVAKLAGVSTAIASTVLSNTGSSNIRASVETSERVRRAAEELGYVPNPAARRLARGRNRILGVFTFEPIFPLTQQNFYHPFLIGIERQAEERDHDLLLFTSAGAGARERQRSIFHGHVNRLGLADGSILLGREQDRTEVSRLIDHEYPFVYIGRRVINGVQVPYVGADYISATSGVVEHLVRLGHRRLAYLGSLEEHEANLDRREGYLNAVKELGLDPGPGWDTRIQPAEVTGARLEAWLQDGVTALVIEDDMLANHVLNVARERGVGVPSDLSIVLLGDALEQAEDPTPWTMFRIPREAIGRQAVQLLLEVLGRSGGPLESSPEPDGLGSTTDSLQIMLPCTFEAGVTTGAAPDARGGGSA